MILYTLATPNELIDKNSKPKTMMQPCFSDKFGCHYYINILNLLDIELQLNNNKPVIMIIN